MNLDACRDGESVKRSDKGNEVRGFGLVEHWTGSSIPKDLMAIGRRCTRQGVGRRAPGRCQASLEDEASWKRTLVLVLVARRSKKTTANQQQINECHGLVRLVNVLHHVATRPRAVLCHVSDKIKVHPSRRRPGKRTPSTTTL